MLLLKRGATVLGLVLGAAIPLDLVKSESKVANKSWQSWLLPENTTNDDSAQDAVTGLRESPGRVVVWGAPFGKLPQIIPQFGDAIVRVAATDGLIVALDDRGAVHGLTSRDDINHVQKLQVPAPAVSIAIRSCARQVVILDSRHRLHTVTLDRDGTFQPAKQLRGALSRAKVERVACGTNHCVAITKAGEAISWGESNSHGQLGRGDVSSMDQEDASVPAPIKLPSGVKVKEAACGDRHTIFLDSSGTLYATGDDKWAQLGISAEPWLKSHEAKSKHVRKCELLTDLAGCTIAGGGQHSVLLVRDGTVFSFGFNQWGQLGHHNYSSLAPPAPITDYKIRAVTVSAGENHTCLVKDTGEMLCIGANDRGQLGNGTLQPSMTWKKVRLGKKAIKPSFIHSNGRTCAAVIVDEMQAAEA